MTINRSITLASRPTDAPVPGNFRLEETPVRQLLDGEVLLTTLFLSLDPYMRGRMDDSPSYAPPVELGAAMVGEAVSMVLESRDANIPVGVVVLGHTGWQSHPIARGEELQRLPKHLSHPSYALGVLGMPGFTAWYGLLKIGKPSAGETVVVSAATGAVGSVVGQLARLAGCRVVGVASGAAKCRYAVEELAFDACLDRNEGYFEESLVAACPHGVDVYFENVGGAVLAAIWPLLNVGARIPVCGLISQYNGIPESNGQDRLAAALKDVLFRRYLLQGFIILDQYPAFYEEFCRAMSELVESGMILYREDIRQDLENAPAAFIDLLRGKTFGKVVVRVADNV